MLIPGSSGGPRGPIPRIPVIGRLAMVVRVIPVVVHGELADKAVAAVSSSARIAMGMM